MNKVVLNTIKLNIKMVNTVGVTRSSGRAIPPEPDIADALLMEDGGLFLMEDGSYFKLEVEHSKTIPDK